MNFTLTYDGDLYPKKKKEKNDIKHDYIKHKQEIRRVFHHQLQELWKGSPVDPSDRKSKNLIVTIGNYDFFPIISAGRKEVAELQIIMLRPGQPPGYIIGQGGDIDNRLKTLFDSLTIPKKSEIPNDDEPKDNEGPFFCLLQDDILITNLSVATDQLLESGKSESYVKLIIRVQTKIVPIIGARMMAYHVRG